MRFKKKFEYFSSFEHPNKARTCSDKVFMDMCKTFFFVKRPTLHVSWLMAGKRVGFNTIDRCLTTALLSGRLRL